MATKIKFKEKFLSNANKKPKDSSKQEESKDEEKDKITTYELRVDVKGLDYLNREVSHSHSFEHTEGKD